MPFCWDTTPSRRPATSIRWASPFWVLPSLQRIGEMADARLIPVCKAMISASKDPWLKFYGAQALLRLGEKEGIHMLIGLLGEPAPSFLKSKAIAGIREVAGQDFGFSATKSQAENRKSVNALEVWWHQNADSLTWDGNRRTFDIQ